MNTTFFPWRLLILLSLTLSSCEASRQGTAESADNQALTDSLIYATREFCVPYIVDGASIASLTDRPGVSELHYNVHGQDVTAYRLQRTGAPEVTMNPQSCSVWLNVGHVEARRAIVASFSRGLQLNGRTTSVPQAMQIEGVLQVGEPGANPERGANVVCVYGQSDALITVSNPAPEYPIYVYVRSDPIILAAQNCTITSEETRDDPH